MIVISDLKNLRPYLFWCYRMKTVKELKYDRNPIGNQNEFLQEKVRWLREK